MRMNVTAQLALCALAGLAASAFAIDIPEVEPNDNKAGANLVTLSPGDRIIGTTTGTSTTVAGAASADNFRITIPAAGSPGIYRHTLALTTSGTAGHIGTIRGLTQTNTCGSGGVPSPTSDAALQTSSTATTPARSNSWYSFGAAHDIIYRVTGTTSTTAQYESTLSTVGPITPISGPTLSAGTITITTVGQTTTDTDFWVYDSAGNAIPGYGNDDEGCAGTTLQSRIVRTFAPGTYTLAISRFGLANNQPAALDEDFGGSILDFPGAVLCTSSSTASASLNVSIGGVVVPITSVNPAGYDVQFVQFTVDDVTAASCGTSTGVEGQNVAIRLNINVGTGDTITGVTVNASSINPSATSVALSDLGGGVWGADVLSQVAAGSYSFGYTVSHTAGSDITGTCPITVTNSASGACCTSGSCAISREYLCATGGGTFQGPGTDCGTPTYAASAGSTTFASIATTGTLLGTVSNCDDCSENVTLPFAAPFNFYGTGYTSVGVSSNGLVVFGGSSTTFTNAVIPTAAAPNNFAAAIWDDFRTDTVGDVYTFYDSVNNTFTISWEGVTQFGLATPDNNNFQVILYGNTNNIELVYGTITAETPAGDYTAGIEDSTGSAASVDAGTPVANSARLITFTPGVDPCNTGPTCDTIDFNNDGLFPDTLDLDDFLSVFGGGPCSNDPNCGDIDFNNDGLFPDTLDIDALLSVFGGGPCL